MKIEGDPKAQNIEVNQHGQIIWDNDDIATLADLTPGIDDILKVEEWTATHIQCIGHSGQQVELL